MKGLIIDLETTGLNYETDKIIEAGLYPFTYDPDTGDVATKVDPLVGYEDPGIPIPEVITNLTGITGEDVSGQKLDDDMIGKILKASNIVIAHNAGFDRKFFEQRFPNAPIRPWACSIDDIDWASRGFECAKLGCLYRARFGESFKQHSAGEDCKAVLKLLETSFGDGASRMLKLLNSARE